MTVANGLDRLAFKQPVGLKIAGDVEKLILSAITCAKASQGSTENCNLLQKHLMLSAYVWNKHKNKGMYDKTVKGYNALIKAASRDTVLLDLSTTEYKDICAALIPYLTALPKIEMGLLYAAHKQVEADIMKERK